MASTRVCFHILFNLNQATASHLIMHKYQPGDTVSFISLFKQQQQGIIQDAITTGGNNAYTIHGYDFLILEKHVIERIAKGERKKLNNHRP